MSKTKKELIVENWNLKHKKGTPVLFWTGLKEGAGRSGVTETEAVILGGHTPVVYIEGVSAVALTHVEPERQTA